MVVKKRDFQKISALIQEFLSKLTCEESTAELRDSLHLALFYLQRYYKLLRCRSLSDGISPRLNSGSFSGSLISNGAKSPLSPACGTHDQFEWKWYNLESPRLSTSVGTNQFSSLVVVLKAAKSGNSELLKETLLEDSENINQVDGLGRNAVMYCVRGQSPEHDECLEMLIKANADLNHQATDNATALHVAAYYNNISALALLLRNKASVNIQDNQGRTAMHLAAANQTVDGLKLLLQFGGNISTVDKEGLTPTMWACHFDQLHNLQMLQQALSRIDPQEDAIFTDTDCNGQSIIHWAVKGAGTLECLEALLSPQSVVLRDNDGKTVLHTAAERGNSAACEMILEVRGNMEGLEDVDKMKRTPAHVAAICGQGEVVDLFLQQGADLLMKDSFGASAVDCIHNKQLHYCQMVLRAHAYVEEETVIKHSASSNLERQEPDSLPPLSGPKSASGLVQTAKDQSSVRDTPDEQLMQPLRNIDVSDLQGFEVYGGSVDMENEQNRNSKKSDKRKRRQSTLMRQSGFVNDNDSKKPGESSSFDLHTEDGDVHVVSNLGVKDDEKEQIIDVEEGYIEIDCKDHFGYSSAGLQKGCGHASSDHSEPENADNCSVSVELSAASLGSDSEGEFDNKEFDGQSADPKRQNLREEAFDSQLEQTSYSPNQSQNSEQRHPPLTEKGPVYEEDHHLEHEPKKMTVASKKKKDKVKKMKHKEPNLTQLISPLPPPRGMVPLQGWGPSGVNKLGGLDPHVIKPVPWEHSSLGPLRQGLPQPAPPTSPKMGQSGYLSLVDGESACERPRTPEPPRASYDVGGDQSLHSPPFQSFKRIPMEGVHDKGMGYGSLGPPHGPLAHANGQALLKSMDVMVRGTKMESLVGKNMGRVIPHCPSGPRPTGTQSFSFHGPVRHPPQH